MEKEKIELLLLLAEEVLQNAPETENPGHRATEFIEEMANVVNEGQSLMGRYPGLEGLPPMDEGAVSGRFVAVTGPDGTLNLLYVRNYTPEFPGVFEKYDRMWNETDEEYTKYMMGALASAGYIVKAVAYETVTASV